MPPPTDPVMHGDDYVRPSLTDGLDDVAGLPSRRRPGLSAIFADFEEIKAGRKPKNPLLLRKIRRMSEAHKAVVRTIHFPS